MILAGRDGSVKWDPTGAGGVTAVEIASITGFKISLKTPKIPVTAFQDTNAVYVQGLPDFSGTVSGWYNSADLTLIEAVMLITPGWVELIPHTSEPTFKFSGKAYLDAELDTTVDGAPSLNGELVAAGPWTLPEAA